jgi:hypothetical protein
MREPRCPGCEHPVPLHTMDCEYRNPLYPILTDLITELRLWSSENCSHWAKHLAANAEERMKDVTR